MLPEIKHPLFTETIPSTKAKISLRPMLVKEEKILLMAKESQDTTSIVQAVKQIVGNCIVDKKINVDNLTLFDIDYLYIKIRANSVDSKVVLRYVDEEDEPVVRGGKSEMPTYNFEIDLNDVVVKGLDETSPVIQMSKDSGLKLKFPEASVYDLPELAKAQTAEAIVEELVLHSFDSYFVGNKVHKFKDESRESISQFIDNLDLETYNKVIEFFNNLPTVYYEVKFKNSKGTERTAVLSKLTDFFTF